ncbi:MAG: hypothetical protein IT215_00800 [Chitinophagaceae bacterium]|nr:MAG: hypothetical protein UZ11_BCD004000257 [Bacteroidetes bacterium OLB11]MCC6447209.1 hypothetical protein [Chitinophagaceae bacterium]HMN32227.1 hypothetical protein [Chitinophagaceae bacterium]
MKKILLLLPLIFLYNSSCKKGPGEGGRAFIKGKVYIKNYTSAPCPCYLKEEYYAQGENVYIQYGDEPGVGRSVKTSYDGSYQFMYLRKGKYKVFALSKDTASITKSKTIEVLQEVEIKKSNENIELPDIIITN